jgi:hypothetical protein
MSCIKIGEIKTDPTVEIKFEINFHPKALEH